jgi:hypothetical protein
MFTLATVAIQIWERLEASRTCRCRKMDVSVAEQLFMSLFTHLATVRKYIFVCFDLKFQEIPTDHMHSHAERDKFVEIKWNNIQPQAISNFDKVDPRLFGNFGTNYDLYSLMHYDKTAFTLNGKDTIVPRNRRYRRIIGQRIGLSVGDVKRINNMYKCKM